MDRFFGIMSLSLLTISGAEAHSVEYQIENKETGKRAFKGLGHRDSQAHTGLISS